MSSERLDYPEQDAPGEGGGDDLPTYDDLAAQSGPNSRFGRWRGWIEKRAAERYIDVSPQERVRRRERGWGNDDLDVITADSSVPVILNEPPTPTPLNMHLQIQTDLPPAPPPKPPSMASPPSPPPLVAESLAPSHLRLAQFGSRFLPHTPSALRCLLPLAGGDRLLLLGHDEGLSVIDMFPREWTEGGLATRGPDEAQARVIWQGEGVHQMSILEVESNGDGTPQGVVLALVGPSASSPASSKDTENLRSLRMYNLASLTSLAKWAMAQKSARPLDLSRPSNWSPQQSPDKKHKARGSITRGFKSLTSPHAPVHQSEPHSSSYHTLLSPSVSAQSSRPLLSPQRRESVESAESASWDVIDDLPLRWATDFVPLASPGSRLMNNSVLSYALRRDDYHNRGRGGAMLAVATKSNILLYETPKGERAFRFVKEFYTPLQPKTLTFVEQHVQEISRRSSDAGNRPHTHSRLSSTDSRASTSSTTTISTPSTLKYGSQPSLFVVFEKKAGIIRIADSAVAEVELFDGSEHHDSLATPTNARRSRLSSDGGSGIRDTRGSWIPPTCIELPIESVEIARRTSSTKNVYILTRGKLTHVVPSPLPPNISATQPLLKLTWRSTPTDIRPRLCHSSYTTGRVPFLQLVSLGEDGIEVQEVSLSFLHGGKGKGKAKAKEPTRGAIDIGGDTGFLCEGGQWHRVYDGSPGSQMSRTLSVASSSSATSFDSSATEDYVAQQRREQGVYGWCRRGLEDFRVFWVGGLGDEDNGYT